MKNFSRLAGLFLAISIATDPTLAQFHPAAPDSGGWPLFDQEALAAESVTAFRTGGENLEINQVSLDIVREEAQLSDNQSDVLLKQYLISSDRDATKLQMKVARLEGYESMVTQIPLDHALSYRGMRLTPEKLMAILTLGMDPALAFRHEIRFTPDLWTATQCAFKPFQGYPPQSNFLAVIFVGSRQLASIGPKVIVVPDQIGEVFIYFPASRAFVPLAAPEDDASLVSYLWNTKRGRMLARWMIALRWRLPRWLAGEGLAPHEIHRDDIERTLELSRNFAINEAPWLELVPLIIAAAVGYELLRWLANPWFGSGIAATILVWVAKSILGGLVFNIGMHGKQSRESFDARWFGASGIIGAAWIPLMIANGLLGRGPAWLGHVSLVIWILANYAAAFLGVWRHRKWNKWVRLENALSASGEIGRVEAELIRSGA